MHECQSVSRSVSDAHRGARSAGDRSMIPVVVVMVHLHLPTEPVTRGPPDLPDFCPGSLVDRLCSTHETSRCSIVIPGVGTRLHCQIE